MKLDKDILIGIFICAVVLFGWDPLCRYMGWVSEVPPAAEQSTAPAKAAENTPAPKQTASVKKESAPAAIEEKSAEALKKLPAITVANDKLIFTIDQFSGDAAKITLKDYKNSKRSGDVVLDTRLRNAGTLPGAFGVFSSREEWKTVAVIKAEKNGDAVKLVRKITSKSFPNGIIVEQNWKIGSGYAADYNVKFINNTKEYATLDAIVSGGDLAPWQYASGDKVRISTHRLDYLTADGDFKDIKADAKENKFFRDPAPQVDWAAVGNKYFCSIIDSNDPFTLWQARSYVKSGDDSLPAITVGAKLPAFELSPGEVRSFDFKLYNGPKIISQLDAFNPSTGRVMHLAWGPLDYLARLLLWVLVKFHDVLHSYGWSIICLTIVVRLLFYPVTAKANSSMKKMQQVQPQLKELREKYKDNPQLLNTKMMELYRKEGVNPFGGCLPILLQIPVFFALYATLDGAVELRQVPFWWCKDLAAADTVAKIPLYFFDLPINPLVLAMTFLMALQQRMTPMSGDPMQKKMMMMMPAFMLIFLYDLPSGLTLYWTVSNLFSIIQLKLQQRAGKVSVAAK